MKCGRGKQSPVPPLGVALAAVVTVAAAMLLQMMLLPRIVQ